MGSAQSSETFREDYPQLAESWENEANGRRVPNSNRRLSDDEKELINDVNAAHEQMGDIGPRPATIINMLPIPLRVSGQHTDSIQVPACPIGDAYIKCVVDTYTIDVVDKGGKFTARAVTAINRARNFERIQFAWAGDSGAGGVSVYMGDHDPRKDEMEKINAARAKWKSCAERLYEEGENEWHRLDRAGKKSIHQIHKLAAQWLKFHKYIKELPQWCVLTSEQVTQTEECPKCGSDRQGKAFACKGCGWLFDPKTAYAAGEIDRADAALMRLSREVLDEMGLKTVPTLEEFRTAQDKKKPKD